MLARYANRPVVPGGTTLAVGISVRKTEIPRHVRRRLRGRRGRESHEESGNNTDERRHQPAQGPPTVRCSGRAAYHPIGLQSGHGPQLRLRRGDRA